MSIRDYILPQPKTATVEAFDATVTVSEMGALDRMQYIDYLRQLQKNGVSDLQAEPLLMAFMAVKCVVEDGKRVFADSEVETVANGRFKVEDLKKVFDAAATLNGLISADVEATAKN
jgi:hypothetical protein